MKNFSIGLKIISVFVLCHSLFVLWVFIKKFYLPSLILEAKTDYVMKVIVYGLAPSINLIAVMAIWFQKEIGIYLILITSMITISWFLYVCSFWGFNHPGVYLGLSVYGLAAIFSGKYLLNKHNLLRRRT